MDVFETNFELYKIFYATATLGSITEAAKQLYLTQPSVTKHIQRLEEELSCTLFVRSKHGVSLTTEGETLLRHVGPACEMILAGEKEMRAHQTLQSGSISIVSTEMSFKSYVLPVADRFLQKYPGIKLHCSNSLNEAMIRMLRAGTVDLAILHTPFTLEEDLRCELIEEMDEYLVCGRRFEALCRQPCTLGDLQRFPFISMPEGSSTINYLRQCFAAEGLEFDPEIVLTTVELTAQAVECGLGIGILPERIAAPLIKSGKVLRVPVDRQLPKRRACLLTNARVPLSPAANAFAEVLKAQICT